LTTPKTRIRKYPHALHPRSTSHITTRPGEGLVSQVIGTAGLQNLGGRIQEEYDRLLTNWSDAIDFYLEMRDDITLSTLMSAMTLPLLAAEFDVEAASDSLVDVAARDWLWDAMNNMHQQSWRSHVQDMLEAPSFGWSLAEIVLQKRKDGRLWIRNLDPRGQETLNRWWFDEFDHTVAFEQRDPDTGRIAKIPMEKAVHMTFGGRKGNPQGRGMFRVLFRTWRFIKNLENLEGIGLERNVGGMPIATLPPEPLSEGDLTKLQDALTNLRMDEALSLIVPDGLSIDPYTGSINMAPMGVVIDRKKKEILMLGFAQFIMLGMSQVGTQALVKGSQDFFTLGLEAIQQQMLESWNGQLVPFLFRFNEFSFPGMTDFPKITWEMPGKADIGAILSAYNIAITSQAMNATRQDEEHFRGIMDLPDMPEVEPGTELVNPVALTGIQISSLQGIIQNVSTKQLPAEAAKLLIKSSFPALSQDVIDRMVNDASAFEPPTPDAPPRPRFEEDNDIDRMPSIPLNGIQIRSLMDVIQQVAANELPPKLATSLIRASFPALSDALIAEMVKDAETFIPESLRQERLGGGAEGHPFPFSRFDELGDYTPGHPQDQHGTAGGGRPAGATSTEAAASRKRINNNLAGDFQPENPESVARNRAGVEKFYGAEGEGAELLTATDAWVGEGGYDAVRDNAQEWVNGEAETGTGAVLARAISESPETFQPMYRGISSDLSPGELDSMYSAGSEFDLLPSSFSVDRQIADNFASTRTAERGGQRVVFEAEPGAKAFNVSAINPDPEQVGFENERLTMGRFQVTGVEQQGNTRVIKIKQASMFTE